jgi:flagellar FliL protein
MADAPDKKEAPEPAAEKSGRGGGSKLLPALLGVNSLMLAGVLGVLLLRPAGGARPQGGEKGEHAADAGGHGKGDAKGDAKAPAIGPTHRLPDFVVRLRDTDADRYARVSFEVEVVTEEDKNKVGAAAPRIRDGFITYLSDRTIDELRGSEGLARTKEQLLDRLRLAVPGAGVKGLYITDIVVQ